MNYKILAVIPARGNSKSIPRKNIKTLAGKSLIAYTIEETKRCPEISRIIVSTEDKEIAEIAQDLGAEVPFLRPKELAEDSVQDLPVFQHCLEWLNRHEDFRPDIVVQLRPTSPLRRAVHIREAIQLFLDSEGIDCVRSVTPVPVHPLKMWQIKEDYLVPFVPEEVYGLREAYNHPRQKLPFAFVQNGAVEVIRITTIIEKHSMSGEKMKAYVMPEEDSVNIDSPLDFLLAEILLKQRMEANDES